MYPILDFFGFKIAMYGLCIVAGIIAGIMAAYYYGDKHCISREDILFSSLYGIIGVVVGGKIVYLIINTPLIIEKWDILISHPEYLVSLFTAGFVFYGGLAGALLGILIYCKTYRLETKKILFCILPAVPLVHAFGRIGCFMAGCCYGIEYQGAGSVVFKNSVAGGAPRGIPLFPVQILEVAVNLVIFAVLVIMMRNAKNLNQTLTAYAILYAISRFLLEFLRGDVERGYLWNLSTSQWISLFLLAAAAIFYYYNKHHTKRACTNS